MSFGENAGSCSCGCAQELRALGTVVEQLKKELEARVQQQEQTLGRALASLVPTVEALSAKIDSKNPPTALRGAALIPKQGMSAPATASADSPAAASAPPPALHSAASTGDMARVRELLAQGADPTRRDAHGDSALHRAAAAGHVAALDALLEAAECSRPVAVGRAAWAASAADARGPQMRTPLHGAAEGGHTDAACSLLAAGASRDALDANGDTPLHRAARGGHCAVAALLLAEGATADAVNKDGLTPLAVAARASAGSVVRLLLEKGADPRKWRDAEGNSVLHLAAVGDNSKTIQFLLDMGMDVNIKTNSGLTALHAAAQKGYVQMIELLLEKGANINAAATSKGGETPLLLAARGGHAQAVATLLAKGASIDAVAGRKNIDPEMSLVAAATGGSSIAVKALAKSGACVNSQVLEAALTRASNADVVWALADVAPQQFLQVADITLPLLAEEGKAEVLQAVLALGVDVLSINSIEALCVASEQNKADCVAVLLHSGVRDNYNQALHCAVKGGHVMVVSVFLEHGMTAEQKNVALTVASENYPSHLEVMKILIDKGAKAVVVNSDEAWEFVKCVTIQKMKTGFSGETLTIRT